MERFFTVRKKFLRIEKLKEAILYDWLECNRAEGAVIVVFLVMNLFTCVWNPVALALIANPALRNTVQSIVTTVVTGGVAMVIIFAVDKTIFSPGWGEKVRESAG